MKIFATQTGVEGRESRVESRQGGPFNPRPSPLVFRPAAGFTMVEIAICLAIIGIALIAIIGVLPIGINVQKDNRQETIIDQDAAVFLNAIRNGAQGLNDLTNYVFAITNFWTSYQNPYTTNGGGVNGYTYSSFFITTPYNTGSRLTNGVNIVGLLSTPKYTDAYGAPISGLIYGGISNHVVAYVRSISGPAVEKPPQNNDIIRGDSFSYKILCGNAPVAVYTPRPWMGGYYAKGAVVSYPLNGQITYWRAAVGNIGQTPGVSSDWARVLYPQELTANLHELRLTFLWPLLPNYSTGNGRHTFATTVAGQVVTGVVNPDVTPFQYLYFFQPQSFAGAP